MLNSSFLVPYFKIETRKKNILVQFSFFDDNFSLTFSIHFFCALETWIFRHLKHILSRITPPFTCLVTFYLNIWISIYQNRIMKKWIFCIVFRVLLLILDSHKLYLKWNQLAASIRILHSRGMGKKNFPFEPLWEEV